MARILAACVVVLLVGCDKPASNSAAVQPADPALARLYEQTCKICHGTAASGAPLAGDRAAWEPRMAKGMKVLLDNTVSGFGGMPPLGACADCTEADFEKLIRFMAGEAAK